MSDFKQGDIIKYFHFPNERPPQSTIRGKHPALVLHDHTLANNTVIIAPISSLHDSQGNEKSLKSFHLKLLKKDYPTFLNDSYIKLDQLMTFSRSKIVAQKLCCLNEKDQASVHLKLIETLQMQDTISELATQQLDIAIKRILDEYINDILATQNNELKEGESEL